MPDAEHFRPFLANVTVVKEWLATDPPEEDIMTMFDLEKEGKGRRTIMNRLLVRAQRLQRTRLFGKHAW